MTLPPSLASELPVEPTSASDPVPKPARPKAPAVQPVLEKLFELYPHLFGAEFLPLKLGVFQELMARHPEHFDRAGLKAALGLHTRSARYLQSVAAGKQRHDLDGAAVEDVAPEHVYLALLELFRRKQGRSKEDLRPKLRAQVLAAFENSGLTRLDYVARALAIAPDASAVLDDAFAEYDQTLAKQEALLRAFDNSGKTPTEFADMYGLDAHEVTAMLGGRAQPQAAPAQAAAL